MCDINIFLRVLKWFPFRSHYCACFCFLWIFNMKNLQKKREVFHCSLPLTRIFHCVRIAEPTIQKWYQFFNCELILFSMVRHTIKISGFLIWTLFTVWKKVFNGLGRCRKNIWSAKLMTFYFISIKDWNSKYKKKKQINILNLFM